MRGFPAVGICRLAQSFRSGSCPRSKKALCTPVGSVYVFVQFVFFDAHRLRKVRKRKERNRLRAVTTAPAGVRPQCSSIERMVASADLGNQGAILAETHSLYRDGADIPALENRAGEGCLTAGSLHHLRTPTSEEKAHNYIRRRQS